MYTRQILCIQILCLHSNTLVLRTRVSCSRVLCTLPCTLLITLQCTLRTLASPETRHGGLPVRALHRAAAHGQRQDRALPVRPAGTNGPGPVATPRGREIAEDKIVH
ncbi:hypothetical protein B484DRAFT_160744 [Ochromonadaceae sp. CCMP2298]|nr:hypothetical protein B484DRAFT_160744 [Ochromonadaceae sp. CCMP2298]